MFYNCWKNNQKNIKFINYFWFFEDNSKLTIFLYFLIKKITIVLYIKHFSQNYITKKKINIFLINQIIIFVCELILL